MQCIDLRLNLLHGGEKAKIAEESAQETCVTLTGDHWTSVRTITNSIITTTTGSSFENRGKAFS